ncbi:hypothetical protein K438DRAFT_2066503 [Mycena galopus ATCC 62051]|nr:hypothetical protein K438DRAFT_2066503 [Mycena galopus ATCC 62051]
MRRGSGGSHTLRNRWTHSPARVASHIVDGSAISPSPSLTASTASWASLAVDRATRRGGRGSPTAPSHFSRNEPNGRSAAGRRNPLSCATTPVTHGSQMSYLHTSTSGVSHILPMFSSLSGPRFYSLSRLCKWYSFAPGNPACPNFVGSVFAACTFNFGPHAICAPHLDFANLAWGWCAITALGNFNPNFGGHLIVWDLGLVIRFLPGSTILIPSTLIC